MGKMLRRVTDIFTDTKKAAPRNDSRGYLMCTTVVGFEPTTASSVKRALYPLSYSAMHRKI